MLLHPRPPGNVNTLPSCQHTAAQHMTHVHIHRRRCWMLPPSLLVPALPAGPEWVRPVLAKSSGADGGPQPMRVVVYDADRRANSPDSLTLTSQDYIGGLAGWRAGL